MPATDKTLYNLPRLHAVFALVSLALLVASIWVIVADHARPWKKFQLRQREIEQWMLAARIDQEETLEQSGSPDARGDLNRLRATFKRRAENWGEWTLRQPLLDAFYTSPTLRIEQIWLPELPINYHFRKVGRFDRCTTCHRLINKTAAGSTDRPAYLGAQQATVTLRLPDAAPGPGAASGNQPWPITLRAVYGIRLTGTSPLGVPAVTIEWVLPRSRAAQAGLEMGDVIVSLDEKPVTSVDQIRAGLLGADAPWGGTRQLTVRRGLPQPFVAHPRLDLFVGSLSPHKQDAMGCTICHDGQGSATSFKWASHTPNTPRQAWRWYRQYGWFDNHDWMYPMRPARFVESGCLQCHHDATQLEPSERFPDPPAPKLVEGYRLVQTFGCFGCHEISGFDIQGRVVGPDMRAEPNYSAVAQALIAGGRLTAREQTWAKRLVSCPDDRAARRRLRESVERRSPMATGAKRSGSTPDQGPVGQLAALLADVERPGTMRRVGPSLRRVASKLDFPFLYSWIRKPSAFRPTTRMPQFFGQWEHLAGKSLALAKAYEPVEIRAIAHYLLNASQPFAYAAPTTATESPSAERGKIVFQTSGCLACHSHQAFPGIHQQQGPDLSRTGAEFRSPAGRRWLDSWLRDPSRYDPRTKMPNPLLTPVPVMDAQNMRTGKVTDPVRDLIAFLCAPDSWKPVAPGSALSATEQAAVHDLALEYLADTFSKPLAEKYLREGIPPEMAAGLKGPERALVGVTPQNRRARQLDYLGQQSILRYGCFGCHDIPGFENARPIGPALSDWGRKDPSQLAFERIDHFLTTSGPSLRDGAGTRAGKRSSDTGQDRLATAPVPDDDAGFYLQAIHARRREGFIWQKLRMPRSYNYDRTRGRRYTDWLRMGRFPFDQRQREAIITFVLGLVAEPAPAPYVDHPGPRRKAITEGLEVINKYNCAGCHVFKMDRWAFDYRPYLNDDQPGDFEPPPPAPPDYPFLADHVVPTALAASVRINRRGRRHAVVHGMPERDPRDGKPLVVDEDGVPLEEETDVEDQQEGTAAKEPQEEDFPTYYLFTLWRPALINGRVRAVGGRKLMIPTDSVRQYPPLGGTLARYLFPVVVARQRHDNPQLNSSQAWGWLPPPLVGEGRKVRADWLYDYLLEPYRIRPAAVLQMPKFNLSPAEAGKLANYFAATDGASYPYQADPRRRETRPVGKRRAHDGRFENALKIIVNGNFCVRCHEVGDFRPQGDPIALAPNLADVYRRLQPEFVRKWIANPPRVLPYTAMPVNIPFDDQPPRYGGISQQLCPGTSIQQVDALVDFLVNYDAYLSERGSIRALVDQAAKQGTAAPAEPAGNPSSAGP